MLTSEARSHALTELGTTRTDSWQLRHAAATDVGRQRSGNEDFFLLHPDRRLFVIADGMGGHAAGDIASRLAAETVAAYFDEADLPRRPDPSTGRDDSMAQHLIRSIKLANSSVFEEASESCERHGMGTTIVALTFGGDIAHWAYVGDSRLYRLRDGRLDQLTRDHSLLEQTIERQDLSGDEIERLHQHFPYKNVLTRAIGSRYVVEVDTGREELKDGDLFVMTTDGVHDTIDDPQLQSILEDHADDWKTATRSIIAECNRAGGPDNITAACVQVRRRRAS